MAEGVIRWLPAVDNMEMEEKPMSSVMPYEFHNPGGFIAEGDADHGRYPSVRESSVAASLNQSVDLSLRTKEGDVVTLSSSSFSGFEAYAYDRNGRLAQGNRVESESVSMRSMTLVSGSEFTFSVKGDLNEQELNDIQSILGTLDGIMGAMVDGNMDDAMKRAMAMDGYESVAGFEADLLMSRSFQSTTTASAAAENPSAGDASNPEEIQGFKTLSDIMRRSLESRDENTILSLETPVEQLLDHYRETLTQAPSEHLAEPVQSRMMAILEDVRQGMQDLFKMLLPA